MISRVTVLRRIAASVLLAFGPRGLHPSPTSGVGSRAACPGFERSLDLARWFSRRLSGSWPHAALVAAWSAKGVRAEWMTPTYPSLTFPNHYTVVTGLHPDHHGIVHNTMRDAKLGAFSLGNREAVGNGAWWGGEPIWVRAEHAGLPTATYFWPGSEAAIQGVRPTRWKLYDDTVTVNARIDTVLEWLERGRLHTAAARHALCGDARRCRAQPWARFDRDARRLARSRCGDRPSDGRSCRASAARTQSTWS